MVTWMLNSNIERVFQAITAEIIANAKWIIGLLASSGVTYIIGRRNGKIAERNLALQRQNTRPVINDTVKLERRTDCAAFDVVITLGCGGVAIRDVDGTVCFEPDDSRYVESRTLRLPSLLPNANAVEIRFDNLHGEVFNMIKLNKFPMGVRVQFAYCDAQDQCNHYTNYHRYEGHSLFLSQNGSSVLSRKMLAKG